jgi:hypothetical protein
MRLEGTSLSARPYPHQTVCLPLYHRVHLELATYAHICSPSYLPSFLGFFLPLGSLAA